MQDQDKSKEELLGELAVVRRQASLLQSLPTGIHECDCEGRITFVNPSQERITGYTADELVGTFIWDRVEPGSQKDSLRVYLRQLVAGQPHPAPYYAKNTRKNGEVFDIRVDWNYLRNPQGQVTGFVSVVSDVTDHKRAEEALKNAHDDLEQRVEERTSELTKANETLKREIEERRGAEERFAKAFHSNPSPMALGSSDGRFIEVNQAFLLTLGYERGELIGATASELDLFLDPEQYKAAASVLREEGHLKDFSHDVRTKSGRVRHGLFSGEVIQLQDQLAMLTVMEDVTERKRAEEALQKEHRTLKHLLQSSDHERQLIGYEIHDELAQQLAGAVMQFDTYNSLKDTKPALAAKAYDAGMTMLKQGHFETRRLIAGIRPPVLDESGVVEAIAHLVNELRRHKGPKIEFRNSVEFDRLVPVLENSIYRICQEALTNACQHSKSEKMRVSLLQQGDHVRIEIRDWGIGFNTRTVRENHYGLEGIRQRTRLLGGKCKISSSPGNGTRIVVELPVVVRQLDE